jgi:periplasmic protein TonB
LSLNVYVKGRIMVRITLCLALVIGLAAPAVAQTGRVYGVVADESGGVLPAVEIRATMIDGGGETIRSVATDGKGSYDLGNLAPGSWTLTMSLPGFQTATRRVTVQTADSLEWSPTLELGSLQETITITTAAVNDEPRVRETPVPVPVPAVVGPQPAPLRAGAPIRVGGSIKPPRKIVHVNPVYPAELAAQGVSGVVILQAVIGPDGYVRDITTLRSPHEGLTLAATGAFNGWQFTPTLLNGVPVAVRMTGTFHFQQQQ